MLNLEQQRDLEEFRDYAIQKAAKSYPNVDPNILCDCLALGAAFVAAFLQENPVVSINSINEYFLSRRN